jgi:hypothetical protein
MSYLLRQKPRFISLFSVFIFFFNGSILAKNLEPYYKEVHKAEAYLIRNQLDSSFNCYKLAFELNNHPFTTHIYNAAVVADKLAKFSDENELLKMLRKYGIPVDELIQAPAFNNFFAQISPRKLKMLINVQPTYNPAYRKEIDSLYNQDQSFRLMANNYRLYIDTIKAIDRTNVKRLLELIEKKGFPSEEKIGILHLTEIRMPKYSTLFLHQGMGEMQQHDFSGLLRASILSGEIENKLGYSLYSRVLGTSDMDNIVKATFVKRKDSTNAAMLPENVITLDSTKIGHFPYKPGVIEGKNVIRREFHLDTYEDNIIKAVYNRTHPEYYLTSLGAISVFAYENKKSFENIKKQLIYY